MQMKEATANVTATPHMAGAERSRLWRFAPVGVIATVIAIAYAMGWHDHFSLAAVVDSREILRAQVSENYLLSLGGFVLVYIVVTAASLPAASVLTILGGFLFGWLVGALAAIVGATVGATLLFLAARSACGNSLRDRASGFAGRLARGFESNAFICLLMLRLTPLIPFCVVNVAPALFNIRPKTFVVATAIGIFPGAFAYASLGHGLDSVVLAARSAGRDAALSDLVTPEITFALACLMLVTLVAVLVKTFLARRLA